MQMLLLDNALDSLTWALKHFTEFLKKDPYFTNKEESATILKQAVLNLNNCLELLFKKMISDKNEVLIYDLENSMEEILRFYKLNANGNNDVRMYDFFTKNDVSIKTIEYNKCINYFCEMYEIRKGYKKAFEHINSFRNSAIHFGINYKHQYYILVSYIEKVLWFIDYELFPKMQLNKRIINSYGLKLLPIHSSFSDIANELWRQLYKNQLDAIADFLETSFNDDEIQNYLLHINRKITFFASTDMEHISARMAIDEGASDIEMFCAYHDTLSKSLIIDDGQSNSTVFAVFVLPDDDNALKKFYCSKSTEGVLVERIDNQLDFWNHETYKNQFGYVEYNKRTVIKMLKNMIDYCKNVEFVDIEESNKD